VLVAVGGREPQAHQQQAEYERRFLTFPVCFVAQMFHSLTMLKEVIVRTRQYSPLSSGGSLISYLE